MKMAGNKQQCPLFGGIHLQKTLTGHYLFNGCYFILIFGNCYRLIGIIGKPYFHKIIFCNPGTVNLPIRIITLGCCQYRISFFYIIHFNVDKSSCIWQKGNIFLILYRQCKINIGNLFSCLFCLLSAFSNVHYRHCLFPGKALPYLAVCLFLHWLFLHFFPLPEPQN